MTRVCVVCEGQTEEEFVLNVLAPTAKKRPGSHHLIEIFRERPRPYDLQLNNSVSIPENHTGLNF